jgi:hypothetical protein
LGERFSRLAACEVFVEHCSDAVSRSRTRDLVGACRLRLRHGRAVWRSLASLSSSISLPLSLKLASLELASLELASLQEVVPGCRLCSATGTISSQCQIQSGATAAATVMVAPLCLPRACRFEPLPVSVGTARLKTGPIFSDSDDRSPPSPSVRSLGWLLFRAASRQSQ